MLSGNLELFALADVLRFVARSGATGAVNIYRPSEGGRILLAEGAVVGASVETFDPTDADGVVEAGLRLMDGGGGDFALDIEPVEGPVQLSVEDFLKTLARRRGEWRKIVAAIGSLDEPLVLTPVVPDGAAEITLSALEWQVAVSADGQRSLREIAHEASSSDFAVAQAVLAMSNAGLLSLHGQTAVESQSVDEDEDEAEVADDQYEVEADIEADAEDESADADEEPEEEAEASDEDLDPAVLLRELGDQQPAAPRARRLTAASRHDQAIRLRSR